MIPPNELDNIIRRYARNSRLALHMKNSFIRGMPISQIALEHNIPEEVVIKVLPGVLCRLQSDKDNSPKSIKNFWEKIEVSDICWVWNGDIHQNKKIWGIFLHNGKEYKAHYIMWSFKKGRLIDHDGWKKKLIHTCGNPLCVRLDHLLEVNRKPKNKEKKLEE